MAQGTKNICRVEEYFSQFWAVSLCQLLETTRVGENNNCWSNVKGGRSSETLQEERQNWEHCIWKFGKRSRGFLSRYSNLGMIYFQRDGGLVWLCQMVGLGSMCNHNCSAAPNICCSKSKVGSKFQNLKTQIGTHLLHVMLTFWRLGEEVGYIMRFCNCFWTMLVLA